MLRKNKKIKKTKKEDKEMKKITSLVLVIVLAISAFALTGCFGPDINAKSEGVMTWEEYNAAAIDSKVVF